MSKVVFSLFVLVLVLISTLFADALGESREPSSVKSLRYKKRSANFDIYGGAGGTMDSSISQYQPMNGGPVVEMMKRTPNYDNKMNWCRQYGERFDECMNSGASTQKYVCSALLVFLGVLLRVY